jgi:hypothetical protein
MIALILRILALVCFVMAAAGVASRVQLTPLGLALWVLAELVP